jgi:hypothetical protein
MKNSAVLALLAALMLGELRRLLENRFLRRPSAGARRWRDLPVIPHPFQAAAPGPRGACNLVHWLP